MTTRGFGDLLELARQTRPHLYRLDQAPPAPLAEVTAEIDERMGPDGVITAARSAARSTRPRGGCGGRESRPSPCACFTPTPTANERAVAGRLRGLLDGVHVVASIDLAPEMREYERASTTAADAYLGPVVGRYLTRLGQPRRSMPACRTPLVMQSSGGLAELSEAADHGARLLLSGAGGRSGGGGRRRRR